MDLVGDQRAQSVQIGAILLFAALIIAFASYQAFVVPNQNRGVEFNHNQQVQSDMQDLRNAIVSARGAGDGRSVSVQLGTRYPSRLLALNPSPPSGSLQTVGTTDDRADITITNLQAAGETGDYWNESRSFNTGTIVYRPNYNVYRNAPTTVYEQTTLYNEFPSGNITLSNQSFIDGTEISLVAINGSVSASSTRATSVDVQPVSSSTQRVRVTDDGAPLTITFTSRRSAAYWDFLEETQPETVASVTNASSGGGFYNVSVELEQGRTYSLQLTKVGVGSGVTDEDAAYLTDVDGDGSTVTQGDTTELTLEVRDRFNNPPANRAEMQVNGSVVGTGNGQLDDQSQTPDEDGQVTFVYNATGSADTQEIQFSYTDSGTDLDTSTPQNVSMTVDVTAPPGGTGGGGGGGAYSLAWTDPAGDNSDAALSNCSAAGCTWDVGGSSDSTLTLRAGTVPPLDGFETEFAVNNTTVGTVSPTDASTDSNGETTTEITASENGVVGVYAASGGSSDVFNLTVENVSSGGGGGNSAPSASFTYSPTNPNTGDSVSFDASGSSDSDGSITSYDWDFGDGTTGNGETTTHPYSSAGTYTVELTVTDDDGATTTTSRTISVNADPSASFTATPDPAETGETITLEASGSSDSDGSLTSYEWDLDDDGQYDDATGSSTTTSYSTAGDKTISLRVTDDDGATDTASQTVSVNQPPAASFTATPDPAGTGETITLDASGSSDADGSITGYEWDLDGDGQYDDATGSSTTTSYSTAGDRTISLRVTDDDGATGTTSRTVTVVDIQNGIRYDGGLTSTGSNSAVQLDITNVGSDRARLDAMQIEARNGVGQSIYNGDAADEITVAGGETDGFADGGQNGNPTAKSLDADGTTTTLDQTAVLNTAGGDSATVFVGQFGTASGNSFTQYDFAGLTKVSSTDNWDVRVTLQFQNRGDVTYYFDAG